MILADESDFGTTRGSANTRKENRLMHYSCMSVFASRPSCIWYVPCSLVGSYSISEEQTNFILSQGGKPVNVSANPVIKSVLWPDDAFLLHEYLNGPRDIDMSFAQATALSFQFDCWLISLLLYFFSFLFLRRHFKGYFIQLLGFWSEIFRQDGNQETTHTCVESAVLSVR